VGFLTPPFLGTTRAACAAGITVTDKLNIAMTFRPEQGYIGTAPDLRQPIIALSLGGLRRKVEAAMSPEDVIIVLNLDKAARLERGPPSAHRPSASGLRRDVGLGIPWSREQAADAQQALACRRRPRHQSSKAWWMDRSDR
jgi:hypothetical protein